VGTKPGGRREAEQELIGQSATERFSEAAEAALRNAQAAEQNGFKVSWLALPRPSLKSQPHQPNGMAETACYPSSANRSAQSIAR
jgi:hypothetical protein